MPIRIYNTAGYLSQ